MKITIPAPYPSIEGHEFELRCAICLRGLCAQTHVLKMNNKDMHGVFVRWCESCEAGIRAGKSLEELRRWTDRQLDKVEGGEYKGQGWWNKPEGSS